MIRLSMMAREGAGAPIDETVDLAAGLGLDGIDIHLSGMDRDPERVKAVRWHCVRRGLTIGYAGSGSYAGPVEEKERRLAQGRQDVDTAALLGAQMLRVFARAKWPDTEEEQERLWAPMVASFQELSDYAAAQGVTLALQNHDESSCCMTAHQALRILGDVDRPNFRFLMDTGQWKGAIGSHIRGEFDPDVDLYEDYQDRRRARGVDRLPARRPPVAGCRVQRQPGPRLRDRRPQQLRLGGVRPPRRAAPARGAERGAGRMTGAFTRSGARGVVPLLAAAALAVLSGCGSSSKAVSVDEQAPAFTLPAADGDPVSLSDLLDDRAAAVLVFYRGFF